MSDIVDMSANETAAFTGNAIANCLRNRQQALSSHRKCTICGAVIPPERRKAMPGVKLCIDCQEEAERGNR